MDSPQVAPPLRRINVRIKVSCDHTRPVCLRCRKRKQDRLCLYTVTPNTLLESGDQALAAAPTARTSASASTSTTPVERSSLADIPPNLAASPLNEYPQSHARGYLGYTSYHAVINETASILRGGRREPPGRLPMDKDPVSIPSRLVQLGVTLLKHLPEPEEAMAMFRGAPMLHDALSYKIARIFLDSFYDYYGESFGPNRDEANLEEIARSICINTSRPISDSRPDALDWLEQFTGPNLRWESIGLMAYFLDFKPTPEHQQKLRNAGSFGEYYVPLLLELLNICLELCDHFADGNFISIFVCFKRTNLETLLSGDASRQSWRYHAQTATNVTFMGMHAEPADPFYKPSFHSEARRRIFWTAFSSDKVLVSFTGRQPLLHRKFITTPMPLDLTDDDLFLDRDSLIRRAEETVSQNTGWNTENGLYSATYVRARGILAKFREAIAEMAVADESSTSIDDVLRCMADQEASLATWPASVQQRTRLIPDSTFGMRDFFTGGSLHLEFKLNEFLLGRLYLKRNQTDDGQLLVTSFDLVASTLFVWTHMDRFVKARLDFEWLVIAFGAPAGGILCKELLKPTFHGQHPKNPEITRSAIIQKLSLLVGFLDWVDKSAPNADLCGDCKAVIQGVLDQALNSSAPLGEPEISRMAADWDFSAQLDFSFELLDTYDWLRPDVQTNL
ncbi:hypothetical protein BX600DRAFT_431479 [Xylariales sp. PMI_506]|nr:hypothetical protein BX600DRAFT_431479 [Xylariales sp. PMI_506]